MRLATSRGRKYALKQLEVRRKRNRRKQRDNSRLPAGSPIYYYCRSCSAQTDIRAESDFEPWKPRDLCEECQDLQERGWHVKDYEPGPCYIASGVFHQRGREPAHVLYAILPGHMSEAYVKKELIKLWGRKPDDLELTRVELTLNKPTAFWT
ncbi:hypothetical protein HY374_00515 [Candidatus Berkelbacteria bacterium]|nr:hypothetical protein [Candidatus Berkelbacteria bacterium]